MVAWEIKQSRGSDKQILVTFLAVVLEYTLSFQLKGSILVM